MFDKVSLLENLSFQHTPLNKTEDKYYITSFLKLIGKTNANNQSNEGIVCFLRKTWNTATFKQSTSNQYPNQDKAYQHSLKKSERKTYHLKQ